MLIFFLNSLMERIIVKWIRLGIQKAPEQKSLLRKIF